MTGVAKIHVVAMGSGPAGPPAQVHPPWTIPSAFWQVARADCTGGRAARQPRIPTGPETIVAAIFGSGDASHAAVGGGIQSDPIVSVCHDFGMMGRSTRSVQCVVATWPAGGGCHNFVTTDDLTSRRRRACCLISSCYRSGIVASKWDEGVEKSQRLARGRQFPVQMALRDPNSAVRRSLSDNPKPTAELQSPIQQAETLSAVDRCDQEEQDAHRRVPSSTPPSSYLGAPSTTLADHEITASGLVHHRVLHSRPQLRNHLKSPVGEP